MDPYNCSKSSGFFFPKCSASFMSEKGLPLKSTSGCRLENVAWQTVRDGRPIFALVAVVNERVWCQNFVPHGLQT